MYLKLFESYVRWLVHKGRAPNKAPLIVAYALSAAALLNGGAVVMLVQDVGGPRILDWMAGHLWMTWVAALVCVVVHLMIAARLPSTDSRSSAAATRVWWTSYMVFTFVLWVFAGIWTLSAMRSSRL